MFRGFLVQLSSVYRRQLVKPVDAKPALYLPLTARPFQTDNRPGITAQIPIPANDDLNENLTSTNITDYNRKNYLNTRIKSLLGCTNEEAKSFISKEQSLKKLQPNFVCNLISLLLQEGVSSAFLLDNPWILLQQEGDIKTKLAIIKRRMKPKKLEDFVPMITLKNEDLLKIAKIIEFQASTTPMGNRIYYFSSRLKAPPHMVTKYFIKYPFMFTKTFESVKENLDVLLEHNVQPIHILRDLRSFRYKPTSNDKRLTRAKDAQKEKLMPWMTRCSERTLKKCLDLSLEKKSILGENDSVPEYLSQRLGYDMEIIEYMVKKHPLMVTVRMKKLKEVLDFLLDEMNFSPLQIVQVPKVLSHSLDTTKARLNELKSIGYTLTSLSNLCKSKREYQKVVDSWKKHQDGRT